MLRQLACPRDIDVSQLVILPAAMFLLFALQVAHADGPKPSMPKMIVSQCEDFNMIGKGDAEAWHYDGGRKIRKKVSATGGIPEAMSTVSGWKSIPTSPSTSMLEFVNSAETSRRP